MRRSLFYFSFLILGLLIGVPIGKHVSNQRGEEGANIPQFPDRYPTQLDRSIHQYRESEKQFEFAKRILNHYYKWVSEGGSQAVEFTVDGSIIRFGSCQKWPELSGSIEMLGDPMQFIVGDIRYTLMVYVQDSKIPPAEDIPIATLFRVPVYEAADEGEDEVGSGWSGADSVDLRPAMGGE